MQLSPHQTERFYRIWFALFHYVNEQRQLVRTLPDVPTEGSISPQTPSNSVTPCGPTTRCANASLPLIQQDFQRPIWPWSKAGATRSPEHFSSCVISKNFLFFS